MTLKAAVTWFFKINGYFPILQKNIQYVCPMFQSNIDKIIYSQLKRSGLRYLISRLLRHVNSDMYEKINKRWEYFLDHNLQLDKNSFKIGDNVIVILANGRKIRGKVCGTSCAYGYQFYMISESGWPYYPSITDIISINGKKPHFNWLIKRNQKVYGTQREH